MLKSSDVTKRRVRFPEIKVRNSQPLAAPLAGLLLGLLTRILIGFLSNLPGLFLGNLFGCGGGTEHGTSGHHDCRSEQRFLFHVRELESG